MHSEYLIKLSQISSDLHSERNISDYLRFSLAMHYEYLRNNLRFALRSHLRFASDFSPNINLYNIHASNKLHSLLKSRSFSTFIINYFSASPSSYKSSKKPTTNNLWGIFCSDQRVNSQLIQSNCVNSLNSFELLLCADVSNTVRAIWYEIRLVISKIEGKSDLFRMFSAFNLKRR